MQVEEKACALAPKTVPFIWFNNENWQMRPSHSILGFSFFKRPKILWYEKEGWGDELEDEKVLKILRT